LQEALEKGKRKSGIEKWCSVPDGALSPKAEQQKRRIEKKKVMENVQRRQAVAALPCIQHILDANRLTWSGVGHHPDLSYSSGAHFLGVSL